MKDNLSISLIALFMTLFILNAPAAAGSLDKSRETAITHTIEKVGPAVASVNVIQTAEFSRSPFFNDPFFEFWFPRDIYRRSVKTFGSGVVISPDGYIITNQHVVEKAQEIKVTLPGGLEYKAEIVGSDRSSDIALLKIEGKDLPYADLGNSDDIIIGEWVVAMGNPFGLADVNKQPTATAGIVSSVDLNLGREIDGRVYIGMIQTDASINPGHSGGPLCNARGEVIGINAFIYTGGGYSEGSIGIGFAIPINRAREIAQELKLYGRIDRSFATGLRVQRVDRYLAQTLDLPKVTGVIITDVAVGSSSDDAGLQVGDVILKVNGFAVNSRHDILKIIEEADLRSGDSIHISFFRDGLYFETAVTLSDV
ncbi:MAG: S1C family serine protease [Fidelibacterota bacterium]